MPASILDLPEEILIMVFKEIQNDFDDIEECQYVCRAWYLPAHLLELQNCVFVNVAFIQKFIQSIDYNPKPSYLNAVKQFSFYCTANDTDDPPGVPLSKHQITKLFCRFPNLKEVDISCSSIFLKEFDDNICNSILESCPKLAIFKVSLDGDDDEDHLYYDTIYKLRALVTEIDIDKIKNPSDLGGMVQVIKQFPRLQKVDGTITLDNIQCFIPVLIQCTKLTEFNLECEKDDQDGFMEKVLTTKSNQDQQQIIERLSRVTNMKLDLSEEGLSTLIFVIRYLTGLDNILLQCVLTKEWTDVQQRLYHSLALDLVRSIKVYRYEMITRLNILSEYFPIMVHKVFLQVSNSQNSPSRVLNLSFLDRYESDNLAEAIVVSNQERMSQAIYINVSRNLTFTKVTANLFKPNILLHDVYQFKLAFGKRDQYSRKVDDKMYDGILKVMPSLKEVLLDIPPSFEEDNDFTSDTIHSNLEKLIIRASPDKKFQSLLDRYSLSFPNLKHLEIQYFSGHWKEYLCEFQVELGRYSLEKLALDVTPVKRMLQKHLKKDRFFVLEVSLLRNSKRYLYKVLHNLSSVNAICDNDLNGLTRGADYLQLHITINSLDNLTLSCISLLIMIKKIIWCIHGNWLPKL